MKKFNAKKFIITYKTPKQLTKHKLIPGCIKGRNLENHYVLLSNQDAEQITNMAYNEIFSLSIDNEKTFDVEISKINKVSTSPLPYFITFSTLKGRAHNLRMENLASHQEEMMSVM